MTTLSSIQYAFFVDKSYITVDFARAKKGLTFLATDGNTYPHRWTVRIGSLSWKTATRQVSISVARSYLNDFLTKRS